MESRALVLHWTFDASESAIDVETGGVAEAACHVNCMLGRGHVSADGTGYFLLDGDSLSLRRLYRGSWNSGQQQTSLDWWCIGSRPTRPAVDAVV